MRIHFTTIRPSPSDPQVFAGFYTGFQSEHEAQTNGYRLVSPEFADNVLAGSTIEFNQLEPLQCYLEILSKPYSYCVYLYQKR